tara:strand:- start:49347 stop:49604 length:258 start_codon:yes stop_codon:yes gene_type:complete
MNMTEKQTQIMSVVVKANPDGSFVDIDQVLERIPYETTKESMQFSVRALIKNQLITRGDKTKRRGRSRTLLAPTELAYFMMRGII